jgi:hypothetical protein
MGLSGIEIESIEIELAADNQHYTPEEATMRLPCFHEPLDKDLALSMGLFGTENKPDQTDCQLEDPESSWEDAAISVSAFQGAHVTAVALVPRVT